MTTDHRNKWMREWRAIYLDQHPEKRMLWAAKKRAKEKGLEFSITEEDIVLPEVCPYIKEPLQLRANRGQGREHVYSLDRIDSSKGYTPDNIEVISHLANSMKSNATKEQLIEFAKTIMSRFPEEFQEPLCGRCRNDDALEGQSVQSQEQAMPSGDWRPQTDY